MSANDATPQAPAERRETWRELAAMTAAAAVAVVLPPLAVAAWSGVPIGTAFARPFWLDEFHTMLTAGETTPAGLLSKLAAGSDMAPPGYYFVLWLWTPLFGTGEVSLRAFSVAAMIAGLVGLYVALRRATTPAVAAAATLALWGGLPQLQVNAYNARSYALWFAFIAWLAAALPAFVERGGWRRGVVAAALALMTALTHWFGVLSLVALGVGQVAAMRLDRLPLRRALLRSAVLVAGPVGVLACVSLYTGQKASLEVPTWVEGGGRAAVEQLLYPFFRSFTLIGAALALVASRLLLAGDGNPTTVGDDKLRPGRLAVPLGLLALPVILVAFHVAIQPVAVARYAAPAAVGVGAAAAALLVGCDRRVLWLAAAALSLLPLATLRLQYELDLWDVGRMAAPGRLARAVADQVGPERPLVVWVNRGDGYRAWRYGGLPPEAVRLAYPEGVEGVSDRDRVERSVAKRMAELFPVPSPIDEGGLSRPAEFVYLSDADENAVRERFPGAEVVPLATEGPLTAYLVRNKRNDPE